MLIGLMNGSKNYVEPISSYDIPIANSAKEGIRSKQLKTKRFAKAEEMNSRICQ